MPNIYTIHDPKVKSDTVCFISETDGSASSYFYNSSIVLRRNDLILIQIASITHNSATGFNQFTDLERIEICRMPEQLDEDSE